MKRFSEIVFDDTIQGAAAVYTATRWNEGLGLGDKLTLQAVADEVGTANEKLTVQIEQSAEGVYWTNKIATAEINAQSIATDQTTYLNGEDLGDLPSLCFVRLRLSLERGSQAHVKLFVTGRDT